MHTGVVLKLRFYASCVGGGGKTGATEGRGGGRASCMERREAFG
jgi:hypothetical protein